MKRLLPLLIILSTLGAFSNLNPVKALDIASTYPVGDTQAVSGDILSSGSKGLIRSNIAYDIHLFGIIADEPSLVYRNTNPDKTARPVLRAGETAVNVTDYNGKIAVGDYITSSPITGKGMKATQSGYVIGIAISAVSAGPASNFQGKSVNSGQVNVALRIEYAELSTARSTLHLFDTLNAALFRNVQDPEKFTTIARYIIAGFVALASLMFGFLVFSRSVSKGIEAIGRNPLAKQAIQTSIILQIVMTIVTSLAGVALAFIIIKF